MRTFNPSFFYKKLPKLVAVVFFLAVLPVSNLQAQTKTIAVPKFTLIDDFLKVYRDLESVLTLTFRFERYSFRPANPDAILFQMDPAQANLYDHIWAAESGLRPTYTIRYDFKPFKFWRIVATASFTEEPQYWIVAVNTKKNTKNWDVDNAFDLGADLNLDVHFYATYAEQHYEPTNYFGQPYDYSLNKFSPSFNGYNSYVYPYQKLVATLKSTKPLTLDPAFSITWANSDYYYLLSFLQNRMPDDLGKAGLAEYGSSRNNALNQLTFTSSLIWRIDGSITPRIAFNYTPQNTTIYTIANSTVYNQGYYEITAGLDIKLGPNVLLQNTFYLRRDNYTVYPLNLSTTENYNSYVQRVFPGVQGGIYADSAEAYNVDLNRIYRDDYYYQISIQLR
jgi:hypothetical protein